MLLVVNLRLAGIRVGRFKDDPSTRLVTVLGRLSGVVVFSVAWRSLTFKPDVTHSCASKLTFKPNPPSERRFPTIWPKRKKMLAIAECCN